MRYVLSEYARRRNSIFRTSVKPSIKARFARFAGNLEFNSKTLYIKPTCQQRFHLDRRVILMRCQSAFRAIGKTKSNYYVDIAEQPIKLSANGNCKRFRSKQTNGKLFARQAYSRNA
jgi:hypothetical protein